MTNRMRTAEKLAAANGRIVELEAQVADYAALKDFFWKKKKKPDDDEEDDDDELDDSFRDGASFVDPGVSMVDRIELDDKANLRLTGDGYLVATPRIARTGIQIYGGSEIGRVAMDEVRVYRPPSQVFSRAALQSLGHRPVTIDHPSERVTADNWKKYSVGQTGDEVVRDGDFVRIPMVLMDKEAIEGVRSGRNQLSVGYTADIVWKQGVTDSGEKYDAVQTNIRGNHLAIVTAARGGSKLVIGDDNTGEPAMQLKQIVIDGITCDVSDVAAQCVQRALRDAENKFEEMQKKKKEEADAKDAALVKLADAEKAMQTKDGEIAALKKQVADSAITPQQLDKMVGDRLDVVAKTRSVLGDKYDVSGKTAIELRRAVVSAKLGDAVAKEMADAAIEGAFAAFTAATAQHQTNGTSRLAASLSTPGLSVTTQQATRDAAWEKMAQDQENAWKRPATA